MIIELSKEQELALKKKWEDEDKKWRIERLAEIEAEHATKEPIMPIKPYVKNSYFNAKTFNTMIIVFCVAMPVILFVLKQFKGA